MTYIKNINIKGFLSERGINPAIERAEYGMYLSPLRAERTPSFKVDYNMNVWYDFGLGEGGSIVDLVARLDNCSIGEAFAKLDGGNFSYQPIQRTAQPKPTQSSIIIDDVKPLHNIHLIDYLKSRAIDIEVAKAYCKEVHYIINGKRYYAIGFKNDKGGWELRNEYFKGGNSPKEITSNINLDSDCYVFEGFMDFLSHLTIQKSKGVHQFDSDYFVLNSVSNLSDSVIRHISHYENVHLFFDNDSVGQKSKEILIQHLKGNSIDYSSMYAEHNDLNDYLKHLQLKPHRNQPMKRSRGLKL